MAARGVDAVVASTPENVAYLTDFWASTTWRQRARRIYAVLAPGAARPAALIIPRGLVDLLAQDATVDAAVYQYGSFYYDGSGDDEESQRLSRLLESAPGFDTPEQALLAALHDAGVDAGCLAVDSLGIPGALFGELQAALPRVTCTDGYALLREIRMIKTPVEVERLRACTAITEAALRAAVEVAGPGVTELELAQRFRETIVQHGATPVFNCIGGGPRGAFPTVEPSERPLQEGDVVRFDIGCFYRQYHSDIARTVAVGRPPARVLDLYAAVQAGQDAALAVVRPGATASAVFRAAVRGVEEHGIMPYRRQHCGHGEGVEGYDPPMIAPGDETVLAPGMVLCVETPYYLLGHAGVQVEDTLVVTDAGYELLTTLPRALLSAGPGGSTVR